MQPQNTLTKQEESNNNKKLGLLKTQTTKRDIKPLLIDKLPIDKQLQRDAQSSDT